MSGSSADRPFEPRHTVVPPRRRWCLQPLSESAIPRRDAECMLDRARRHPVASKVRMTPAMSTMSIRPLTRLLVRSPVLRLRRMRAASPPDESSICQYRALWRLIFRQNPRNPGRSRASSRSRSRSARRILHQAMNSSNFLAVRDSPDVEAEHRRIRRSLPIQLVGSLDREREVISEVGAFSILREFVIQHIFRVAAYTARSISLGRSVLGYRAGIPAPCRP